MALKVISGFDAVEFIRTNAVGEGVVPWWQLEPGLSAESSLAIGESSGAMNMRSVVLSAVERSLTWFDSSILGALVSMSGALL